MPGAISHDFDGTMSAGGNRRWNAADKESIKQAMTFRSQENTIRAPRFGFTQENVFRVAFFDNRGNFKSDFV